MFLVNSRNPRFTATRGRSGSKFRHARGHTFSRSYGAILPSSLASVLSRALGYSPRPPESVCGTGTEGAPRAAFLGSLESPGFESENSPHYVSELALRLWLSPPAAPSYALEPPQPNGWPGISFSVPARFNAFFDGAGILTCFPSPTPFGLGLGPD